jgi:eukaryotic-like serine/threonine-protein kinase
MGWVARGGKQDTDRIADRYRLVERLGAGGMSVVWRGYDETLGRQVAVKVLAPQLAGDDTFRDRLRQEALAAARLCHPHITGVFDLGESPLSERLAVPYVVMELNDGESVSARLRRCGPLGWRDAVVVAAEVASALATAHAWGVVHRDVTPANVMLTSTGAKVVDFGISALVGQRDAAPDGSLLGTPAYLAPERLGGGHVSPATDVYGLGLLLYRCLTGRLPWPAETTTQALRAHLYADPEPLPALPGMPPEVAALCLRSLAKKPEDRPAAAELARALAAVVGGQPIIAPADSAAVAGPTVPLTTTAGTEPPGSRPVARPGGGRSARPAGRASLLRLRVALKVGATLHLGNARPLGGGLFAGGWALSTGGPAGRGPFAALRDGRGFVRSALAGRHRVQAAAATVTLLLAIGAGWPATRGTADAVQARAAAAGAGPAVLHRAACKVRYQVKQDDGSGFEALLTVVNTGERALAGWRAEFAYPGTQRLLGLPAGIDQNGRRVLVHAAGDAELGPGRAVAVTLRGAYRETNPLPLAFTVDGHRCTAEVLGPTSASSATADARQVGQAGRVASP